jgi:hypothetical protein
VCNCDEAAFKEIRKGEKNVHDQNPTTGLRFVETAREKDSSAGLLKYVICVYNKYVKKKKP